MTTRTSSTRGVSQPQQQQQQQQQQHAKQQHQQQQNSQSIFFSNTTRSAGNDSASQFIQHHPPQFITPSFGLIRFPNNNFGGVGVGGDHFTFAHNAATTTMTTTATASVPYFIGPSASAVSAESLNNNNNSSSNNSSSHGFKTPIFNSSAHLGRHWKQMGCHTRQYLQPSIPLPASTRLTSAAKHLRGASLGGPPGSLSPLTPNKSWAQIVASSTPRQKKPHHQQQQQQQQQHPSQSVLTAPSSSGISLKRQQQPPPPTAVTSGVAFNKAAAAAGVPPPQFGGGGGGKPAKNASLRAITGLGVSTSSNRDFKSLLLRLKTALEKEKEKWRPKWNAGGGSGGGGGEERNIGCHVPFSDGGDNPRDQEQHRHHSPVIGGKQRDECIFWLAWILRKFQFSAETMSLSVALFDAVLTASSSSSSPTSSSTSSSLSVTAENCKLVVLVCMQLSAKFSEEDADVPTTRDLLAVSEIGADSAAGDGGGGGGVVSMEAALKMERVILTALDWDLNRPTPLKFLEILHTLLMY